MWHLADLRAAIIKCFFPKSCGIKNMVVSILSHGLMTWMIWGTPMTSENSIFTFKNRRVPPATELLWVSVKNGQQTEPCNHQPVIGLPKQNVHIFSTVACTVNIQTAVSCVWHCLATSYRNMLSCSSSMCLATGL